MFTAKKYICIRCIYAYATNTQLITHMRSCIHSYILYYIRKNKAGILRKKTLETWEKKTSHGPPLRQYNTSRNQGEGVQLIKLCIAIFLPLVSTVPSLWYLQLKNNNSTKGVSKCVRVVFLMAGPPTPLTYPLRNKGLIRPYGGGRWTSHDFLLVLFQQTKT